MDWSALKDRLIEAVAAAAVLGGGAQIVSNTVDVGRHDTRLESLEARDELLRDIQKDVAETRETVVRLEAKMEKDQ